MKRNDVARAAGAALVLMCAASALPTDAAALTRKPPAKAAPATATPAAAAILKVAPIVYRERRLANGLQVITVESHSSPTVSVQVWYHVGSRDDPAGRSGF